MILCVLSLMLFFLWSIVILLPSEGRSRDVLGCWVGELKCVDEEGADSLGAGRGVSYVQKINH